MPKADTQRASGNIQGLLSPSLTIDTLLFPPNAVGQRHHVTTDRVQRPPGMRSHSQGVEAAEAYLLLLSPVKGQRTCFPTSSPALDSPVSLVCANPAGRNRWHFLKKKNAFTATVSQEVPQENKHKWKSEEPPMTPLAAPSFQAAFSAKITAYSLVSGTQGLGPGNRRPKSQQHLDEIT